MISSGLEPYDVVPIITEGSAGLIVTPVDRLGLFFPSKLLLAGHRQPNQQVVLVFQRGHFDLDSKTDHTNCLFYAFGSIVCQNRPD